MLADATGEPYSRAPVKDPSFYVGSLLDLPKLTELAERRAAWRQSIAALAAAPDDDGPGPLEGLHPEALLLGVKVALAQGFADDLDWLSPAAAGSALYELASSVPFGQEKRELGRRALSRLLDGDAQTFIAIATRMVRASGRGLGSAGMRARVALVVELPIGLGIDSGPSPSPLPPAATPRASGSTPPRPARSRRAGSPPAFSSVPPARPRAAHRRAMSTRFAPSAATRSTVRSRASWPIASRWSGVTSLSREGSSRPG